MRHTPDDGFSRRANSRPAPGEMTAARGPPCHPATSQPPGITPRPSVATAAATTSTLQRVCRKCNGTLRSPCLSCGGSGRLPLSGYANNNSFSLAKVVGTSWTAITPALGRTHFHAVATRVLPTGGALVRLVATCDPSIVLWVPPAVLRKRWEFAAGSLTKTALAARRAVVAGDGPGEGAACRTCGGSGDRACPFCSAAGEVVEV